MSVKVNRPVQRADLRTTATKGEHTFYANAFITSPDGRLTATAYRYENEVCSLGERHTTVIGATIHATVARAGSAWVLTTDTGRVTKHSTRRALLNRAIRYALAQAKVQR